MKQKESGDYLSPQTIIYADIPSTSLCVVSNGGSESTEEEQGHKEIWF